MSDRLNCTELTDVCTFEVSVYGYKPSLAANALFCALFGILCIANVGLGIRYKTWSWMAAVSLGCLTETIGYVGRLLMRDNPFSDNGFIVSLPPAGRVVLHIRTNSADHRNLVYVRRKFAA